MNTGRIETNGRLLLVMRHGEAEPHSPGGDEARELTDAGLEDSRAAGAWVLEQGLRPDLVVVSTATRTRQTWEGVQRGGVEVEEVEFDETLFNGTLDDLTEVVRTVPDDVSTLLVIAHAPGVEELATCAEVRCDLPDVWEPATLGVLTHEGDWSDFPAEGTVLVRCRVGGSEDSEESGADD